MKFSRSRVSSIQVRLRSRTRLLVLAASLTALFPITAPGVTNPGFAIDYSDLTEEKLAWRKNLFTETEFRNGVADLSSRSTGVTASTIAGYAGAIAFPVSAASEYAYKSVPLLQGAMVGFSLVIEMGDDLGPPVIGGNLAGVDASPVVGGAVVALASVQLSALGGRLYLLRVLTLAVPTTTTTYGIVRYAGNSTRTLKVTAYMLNLGALQPYQMLTDVSTEFLASYPYHALYRDRAGTVACYQLEDLCGLALDVKFGGATSLELHTPNTSSPVWNAGLGRWVVSRDSGGTVSSYVTNVALTAGKTYRVEFDAFMDGGAVPHATDIRTTAGGQQPDAAVNTTITSNGQRVRGHITSQVNGVLVIFGGQSNNGNTYGVSNLSVREVYGDHAVQAATGDRPVISAKYNQLPNSAWQGGGVVPVGWSQPTGIGGTTASAGVDGNVIYRFVATANRPFFGSPNIALAVGQVVTLQAKIEAINSGGTNVQELVLFAPSTGAGTNSFTQDGVVVAATAPAVAGAVIACTVTCTTAGTFIPRVGAGCSGSTINVDVSMSRPMLTPGGIADAPRYQRTNSDGTYDYAGFPIGARCNGINSWMQMLTSSIAGRGKLVLAASYRKDADPSVAVDQAIVEIGSIYANGPGRIVLATSVGGNTLMGAYLRGASSTVGAAIAMPAPSNAVLFAGVDWTTGAPLRAVRRNGAFIGSTPSPLVGGEGAVVDAQAIYIGRRGGTGTSLNGMIYRIFGYGVDFADRYGQIEGWLNERTRVPLQ